MRRFFSKLAKATRRITSAPKQSARRASLHVEALESRQLLSGNPMLILPHPIPILDPIQMKYLSLGGAGGVLGKSTSAEMATPFGSGLYETFQHGAIFYSAGTGAHDVLSPTEGEFFLTGFEVDAYGTNVEKILGLPTADQGSMPGIAGATVTPFQGGKIYASAATGAHVVYGAIGAEYAATAFQKDAGGRVVQKVLGLPTSDEMNVPGVAGGRMNTFQGGDIFWSPSTGAHDVYGCIFGEYLATANEKDYYGTSVQKILGLPTSDEMNVPGVAGGRMNTFQGGDIFWSPSTSAHVVYGAILGKFNSLGGAAKLGLPTTDETATPDGSGRFNHFAGPAGAVAAIDWTQWTGAHAVTGAIAAKFAASGWEKMGEAVTDEIDITHTGYAGAYNRFQTMVPFGLFGIPYLVTSRSAIDWTKATGAYVTHGTQYSDIVQGGAPTCWLDASVAELEDRGVDLSNQIHYQGNNWYTVSLYAFNDPNNHAAGLHAQTEWVYFDGTRNGADMQWNSSDPAASWTVIMQRGVLEALGIPITSPPGGDPANALSVMTGRATTGVGVNDPALQTKIESALAAGKAVCLCTIPSGAKTLVSWHCYAVLSANASGLTLYNPWGFPVSVSWGVVAQDVAGFAIC